MSRESAIPSDEPKAARPIRLLGSDQNFLKAVAENIEQQQKQRVLTAMLATFIAFSVLSLIFMLGMLIDEPTTEGAIYIGLVSFGILLLGLAYVLNKTHYEIAARITVSLIPISLYLGVFL